MGRVMVNRSDGLIKPNVPSAKALRFRQNPALGMRFPELDTASRDTIIMLVGESRFHASLLPAWVSLD